MTMQTTTLPFQVSGANALSQPQRNAAAGVQAPENGGFGATLSREIAQRQAVPNKNTAPAPAAAGNANRPANQNTQAKAADKPAAQGPKAAAREPARQNEAAPEAPATAQAGASANTAESAKTGETAEEAATAAAAAASNPVTDMLAFMASLAQPAQAAAPAATVAAETPLAAATGGEQQLAALESAFSRLEGAGTAATTTAEPGLAVTADDGDAGFSLSTGVQPSAAEAADLRTVQQAAQGAAQAAADPAKLQAQAREAAAAEIPAAAEAPAPAVTQLQAQAAKLDALNPAAMPADRIPARVGTQAWDNQVSQRVVYMIGKEQAATLTLNPPDLGPVQIVLNVSNDQASVAFSSNQLEVRQALENALPRLRDMMSESGIALGNATVDAGVADNRQAQQDGERRNQGGNGAPGVDKGNAAATDTPRPATRTLVTGSLGAVDTFA